MKKEISADLLKRYLEGNCSEEEEKIVNAWYDSFDGLASDKTVYEFLPEELEEKMLNKINEKINPSIATSSKNKGFPFVLVAASISILLLIGWLVIDFARNEKSEPELAYFHIENKSKSIRRVSLQDGSIVWLKPHSEIEYASNFVQDERRLTLKGEAFFVVEKDPDRPFVISTNKVITKVLGTSFNIKAYDEAGSIEVEVLTGKVSVNVSPDSEEETDQGVLLTPREKASYDKLENQLKKLTPQELPSLDIWQSSNFSFDNVPVKEVIESLREKFHIEIQPSNKNLLNCLIRADFNNQNLPDILELLSKSIEATYEVKGDTFFLVGEGCSD